MQTGRTSENFDQKLAALFGALDSCAPEPIKDNITVPKPQEDSEASLQHEPQQQDSKDSRKSLSLESRKSSEDGFHQSAVPRRSPGQEGSSKSPFQSRSGRHSEPRHREIRASTSRRSKVSSRRPVRAPDFIKNPAKWTKYDLHDDGTRGLRGLTDDQVNKYAAFQFLDNLKRRGSSEHSTERGEERETPSSFPTSEKSTEAPRVVFRKPKSSLQKPSQTTKHAPSKYPTDSYKQSAPDRHDTRHRTTSDERGPVASTLRGTGVLQMPEYVVGRNAPPRRKRPKLTVMGRGGEGSAEGDEGVRAEGRVRTGSGEKKGVAQSAVVSLSHLEEEEED